MSATAHAETLARLLPPVAYSVDASAVRQELASAASVLTQASERVMLMLSELDPRSTYALLEAFEHAYGVPDYCADLDLMVADRRLAVVQKIAETGGMTLAYFEAIARALGYDDARAVEFLPWACTDACNEPITDDDWRLVWSIQTALAERITYFDCNSPCTDPLANWSAIEPLICVLNKLKPAHTTVLIELGTP